MRRMSSVTLEDVRQAKQRIGDSIHYTPVITSSYLNSFTSHQLYFKCENMQKTGSFKVDFQCSYSLILVFLLFAFLVVHSSNISETGEATYCYVLIRVLLCIDIVFLSLLIRYVVPSVQYVISPNLIQLLLHTVVVTMHKQWH